jgi:rsbT antagonist protein RsbS
MAPGEDVGRIALQVSQGIVVASVQTDLEEEVLARFQQDVLERIHAERARGLILELSGLETLDPEEFDGLRRIIAMARIMGTETVIVGLSAGIVSALITAGVEVAGLRATLGLDEALQIFEAPAEKAEADLEDPEPTDPAMDSAAEA